MHQQVLPAAREVDDGLSARRCQGLRAYGKPQVSPSQRYGGDLPVDEMGPQAGKDGFHFGQFGHGCSV